MRIRVRFEPRDLWIGAFFKHYRWHDRWRAMKRLVVFICLVPCLPIVLLFNDRRDPARDCEADGRASR